MSIPTQQARRLFTEMFLGVYREQTPNSNFLTSFFREQTTNARFVGIEVERGTEKIAVDVLRGTGANRNTFNKFSEKKYEPPFYSESFDASSLDKYDIAIGQSGMPNAGTIKTTAREIGSKMEQIRKKIDRAKELQAANVFETGIVELKNNDSIDFKRKASSKVDNTGDPWNSTGAAIESQLVEAGNFIRTNGKSGAKTLNAIMRSDALIALKKSDYFKNNANFQQVELVNVNMPQVNTGGSVYHGMISAGPYRINLWTYDEMYTDESGNTKYYIPFDQVVVLPTEGAQLEMVHAGVPAIIRDRNNAEFGQYIASMESKYWMNNYIDDRAKAHIFELYSAPLAVPVTIDMIYTMKVLTSQVTG